MSPTAEMIRKSFSSAIKQAADPRTFAVTISTGSVDRDHDTINPRGWKLQSYRANPVVLWQHRHDIPPIARATDVREQGNNLVAAMEFPPKGLSPLADEICGLMEAGFLHSTSVGFLPLRSTPNGRGHDIHEAELMEFSVVNIPSQVEARVMRCAGQSCDTMRLKSWLGHSWQHHKEGTMYRTDNTLEDTVARQLAELFRDQVIDKDDGDDAFHAMLAQLRQAWPLMSTEMSREELGARVDASFRTLGPNASIADLVRALSQQGTYAAPKGWQDDRWLDIDDGPVFDIDEQELATAIAQVVGEATGEHVRSALNAALGRLD